MILVGRYMSPYVRRVAVAMQHLGLPYERVIVNAVSEVDKVRSYNPIGRVPVLILDDGEKLIESAAILDYLGEVAPGGKTLLARSGPERRKALQLAAVTTNAVEKAIYAFYETSRRPAELVHPPVRDYLQSQTRAGLELLESAAPDDGWLVGDELTLADITVGVGWRFLSLFAPALADEGRHPRLAAHSARCERLSAFAAAQPETA
jgi:glutathione S-transferase